MALPYLSFLQIGPRFSEDFIGTHVLQRNDALTRGSLKDSGPEVEF
jgi:hypothetical protein